MPKRTPYEAVRGAALYIAWRKVRENGMRSLSAETREAIRNFDSIAPRNLRRIDDQLRNDRFKFLPQTGILKKRTGKKPRPIVFGAIENRIVQRSILDVLQLMHSIIPILDIPSSFGGIRGKGRQEAIAAVYAQIKDGARYFLRSDIQDFFMKIPRPLILDYLAARIQDSKFLDLVSQAMETTLANLSQMGEDADRFPLGEVGVAQGSPLSPLMGNILLADFDREMNGRGVACFRYIDDFVILGQDLAKVQKAFQSAQKKLGAYDMQAYDPTIAPDKAEMGETSRGFDFLGCRILPGYVQPSAKARKKLMALVGDVLKAGRVAMVYAAKKAGGRLPRKRLAQTLVDLDNILSGWGHSYAFCNNQEILNQLDQSITKMLVDFLRTAGSSLGGPDPIFRRVLGVHLLSDTPLIPLISPVSKSDQ